MKALDLLVALCDTDAEETKYCHYNEKGSLNQIMLKGTWVGGFTLTSGEPEEGVMYLVVDVVLKDCKPDLIYQHKHKREDFECSMFCYKIDEIISDEELGL